MRATITMLAAMQTASILVAAGDGPIASSAFVKGSEVYVTVPGSSEPRQITSDGLGKGEVALAKDGTLIAFVRETKLEELADIVVMRPDGTTAREIHFRPAEAHVSGMRFVEGLQWITNRRLAVSGSMNPSNAEYAVVDLETGKEVAWYPVDGFGFAPSPDGSHVAYERMVVHFTPEADRRPELCVDDECLADRPQRGYPSQDRHVEFTSYPVWSPDGTRVAITAEDYTTKAQSVIVRQPGGRTVEFTPPPEAGVGGAALTFSWQDNTIYISKSNGEWKLQSDTATWLRMK
jgi:hypothetical protein